MTSPRTTASPARENVEFRAGEVTLRGWVFHPAGAEHPAPTYDSDGLPVTNPELFFAARDDDGTLMGLTADPPLTNRMVPRFLPRSRLPGSTWWTAATDP